MAERRGAGDVEGADKLVADTLVIAAGLGLAVLALLQIFGVPVSYGDLTDLTEAEAGSWHYFVSF